MTPEEKEATIAVMRGDVKTCVMLVAAAIGKEPADTLGILELYYHVRKAYEDAVENLTNVEGAEMLKAETVPPKKEVIRPKAEVFEPKAEMQDELPPPAKAAIFKREIRERLQKMIKEKDFSYPKLAKASGLEETMILKIMEGKQVKVEYYKAIEKALDKLES